MNMNNNNKIYLILPGLILAILLAATSGRAQETYNVSSYYPSPSGDYDHLRLLPYNWVDSGSSCSNEPSLEGVMIYDNLASFSHIRICNGGGFENISSPWSMSGDTIFPKNINPPLSKDELFVGLGTNDPPFRLTLDSTPLTAISAGLIVESTFGDPDIGPVLDLDASALFFISPLGALRIGYQSSHSDISNNLGVGSIALGYSHRTPANHAIAIGNQVEINGQHSIGIGSGNVVNGEYAVGIYTYNDEVFPYRIGGARGQSDSATGDQSIAIGGRNVTDNGISIGHSIESDGLIVIGHSAGRNSIPSGNQILIGDSTGGAGAKIAIGKNATSVGGFNILGHTAAAESIAFLDSLSIGRSIAAGCYNTAIGQLAYDDNDFSSDPPPVEVRNEALGFHSVAIGAGNKAYSFGSVAIGSQNESGTNGQKGTDSSCGTINAIVEAVYRGSAAIGTENIARRTGSIALGYQSRADEINAIAIGNNAHAQVENSYTFGQNATVSGSHSVLFNLNNTERDLSGDNVTAVMGGRLGIGTTAPGATLHVTGAIVVESEGSACNGANEGELRYDALSGEMQYCDGIATWVNIRSTRALLVPTNMRRNGNSNGDFGGYDGLKSQCDADEHVCSTAEIVNYYGMNTYSPTSQNGWVISGEGDNNCKGWNSSNGGDYGTVWTGTELQTEACNETNPVFCCK